jgi:Xaa-Pro aminopeptidase
MRSALFNFIVAGFLTLQAFVCLASDNSYYAARREAVMEKMEGSIAVLQGASDTRSYTVFRQDNSFYYLTGVEAPDVFLLLDASHGESILFLPPFDRNLQKWEGPQLFAGPEARRETGVDQVMEVSQLETELQKRTGNLKIMYVPLSPQEIAATSRDRALKHQAARRNSQWDGRSGRPAAFENKLREKLGTSMLIKDLSPILDEMRRVKDKAEIERLREAGRISSLGLKEAIRSAKPGMFEHQIAAVAQSVFLWHGASGPAFFPIVGSGPNSCIPHYHKNSRKMIAGDVVLFDFGSDYRYYVSDVTRTFPISGRFSREQAEVYRIVLDAQRAALETVRPGATFEAIEQAVREVLKARGYDEYLTHAVAHYVGMAVHDVGAAVPFEPGVVIAVEPGVYLPEKNLGIRIEDTVLVTEDGYEVLTGDVPKEIDEIEKLMDAKGIGEWLENGFEHQ